MNILTEQVKTNLEYHNLWTDVKYYNTSLKADHNTVQLLSGIPPNKLHSLDPEKLVEWLVPQKISIKGDIPLETIDSWFVEIEELCQVRPKRITVALVNDDSTVVYYFVHDGIVKPRQN